MSFILSAGSFLGMIKEEDSELRLDQLYKLTLEDPRVLAMHLRLLREFEGMSDEEVLGCVDLTPAGKAMKINTELYSPEGPLHADNAFHIRMPDGKQEMIAFIEGQGWIGNWDELYNRMLIYGFRFLDAARRTDIADHSHGNLPLVRGMIVVFNPPARLRNKTIEAEMAIVKGKGLFRSSVPIRLTFLFLGMAGDLPGTDLGGLNLLYARGIGKEERAKRLWEDYKIRINASIGKEDDIMNIAASFRYDGKMEGIAIGREEGKNEMAEYMTDAFAKQIVNYAKNHGITIEEAMACLSLPEEYADKIERKARKQMSDSE
jgi:hypothetical protein